MRVVNVNNQETVLETVVIDSIRDKISVQITNTGSVALSSFNVKCRATRDDDYVSFYAVPADWTDIPSESLIRLGTSSGSATSPITLASGEDFIFLLDHMSAFYDVQFTASVSSGETEVEISIGAGR